MGLEIISTAACVVVSFKTKLYASSIDWTVGESYAKCKCKIYLTVFFSYNSARAIYAHGILGVLGHSIIT